ncbi:SDR family oxidoreductase [Rhizobium sp. TRM96647]|uniref:SDR family oxidoreductase n=1 Tax=unclassified Rhizobium TaxID=2613769 RepID=UPI0021E808AB|nr:MULTISPECIES: SDR family oxidoreductase [unclassified Rhizobium]MCV3736903.1 SDR family oxidoreductase [Rhizobium sp. TRM96647]MCV3756697.1 SDR family oxidoreductase [Rhizobium sp. TRM96650]
MSNNLLITGASGQLGRIVLDQVLASGKVAPTSVIAASRDPAKLADYAARGVTVRKADFDDPASLPAAFAGADRVLIISTDALGEPGKRLAQHVAAVEAAVKAGAKRILYTSLPQPDDSAVTFAGDHLGTENAIKASGVPYTIFRNGWYMENLFMALPHALQAGQWFSAAGDGRIAHVARRDVGAAIAAGLLAADGESRIYTLTGSVAHTTEEIAAAASRATGRTLQVVHVTDEQLAEGLKAAGLPEAVVPTVVSFETNTREGKIAMATGDVEELTGRKSLSLDAFLAENAKALTA